MVQTFQRGAVGSDPAEAEIADRRTDKPYLDSSNYVAIHGSLFAENSRDTMSLNLNELVDAIFKGVVLVIVSFVVSLSTVLS